MLRKLSETMDKYAEPKATEPVETGSTESIQEGGPSEGEMASLLEKIYNDDRVKLAKVLTKYYGKVKARLVLNNRMSTGSWLEGLGTGSFADFNNNKLIKYAAVEEGEAKGMARAMLASSLAEGYMIKAEVFKNIYQTIMYMMHPDRLDARIQKAEEAGYEQERIEGMRKNKERAAEVVTNVNNISNEWKKEVKDPERDEAWDTMSAMKKINEIYPFPKFLNYMLTSNYFPGFFTDDLASVLVKLDQELPTEYEVGFNKFKSFFESEGVQINFNYIEEYYNKHHISEEDDPLAGSELQQFFGAKTHASEYAPHEDPYGGRGGPEVAYKNEIDSIFENAENIRDFMRMYKDIAEAKLSKEDAIEKVSILGNVVAKADNFLNTQQVDPELEATRKLILRRESPFPRSYIGIDAVTRLEGTGFVWDHLENLIIEDAAEKYSETKDTAQPEPQEPPDFPEEGPMHRQTGVGANLGSGTWAPELEASASEKNMKEFYKIFSGI